MYKAGDLVIYSGEGVCRVEEIGVPALYGAAETRLYYTLQPLYRKGRVYSPVDSKVFMRPVITRDEAEELIIGIPSAEAEVCDNRNIRFLSEHYQERIRRYDCMELVKLIKAIYKKKQLAAENGKKLGQIDERFMRRAEDMLYGELAVALDIPRSEVLSYISSKVGEEHVTA